MSQSTRPIGQIFVNLGRLTPDDVSRALAYQGERGGFFGEALVALGLLTPDELRWGLADQHGLPFVQLHPDQIDHALARLVPAGWARQHMVLPVLRHEDTVTVVVADPSAAARHAEQVQRFTGAAHVDAAVCPAEHLAGLMDAVFAAERPSEASFRDWLGAALRAGAERLGVSARGGAVHAWEERGGAVLRTTLQTGWLEVLHDSVVPFVDPAGDSAAEWTAVLHHEAGVWRVRCHALRGGRDNVEWVADVDAAVLPDPRTARVDADLRAGVGAAGAVVVHAAAGPGVGDDVLGLALPLLPLQLRGPGTRSFHLAAPGQLALPGVLTRAVGEDAGLEAALGSLCPFRPDALTADVPGLDAAGVEALAAHAPLLVYRAAPRPDAPGLAVRLVLRDSQLVWTTD